MLNFKKESMTCGDNEQCSNSNVHWKITKQDQSEHGPL